MKKSENNKKIVSKWFKQLRNNICSEDSLMFSMIQFLTDDASGLEKTLTTSQKLVLPLLPVFASRDLMII